MLKIGDLFRWKTTSLMGAYHPRAGTAGLVVGTVGRTEMIAVIPLNGVHNVAVVGSANKVPITEADLIEKELRWLTAIRLQGLDQPTLGKEFDMRS